MSHHCAYSAMEPMVEVEVKSVNYKEEKEKDEDENVYNV